MCIRDSLPLAGLMVDGQLAALILHHGALELEAVRALEGVIAVEPRGLGGDEEVRILIDRLEVILPLIARAMAGHLSLIHIFCATRPNDSRKRLARIPSKGTVRK